MKRSPLLLTAVVVVTGVAAPETREQSPQNPQVIYACLQRNDRFRIVDANEVCRANEVRVTWNTVGPQGPTGPTGPTGPQGQVGATGPQGAIGPTGPQGPQGPEGQVGAQGPAGPQGPAGADGATGATGSQGLQGEQGEIGKTGQKGATGEQGPAGPPGASFVAVPQDENTAMLSASNVFVSIPGFDGGDAFVPVGISRIGIDIAARELTTGLDVEYRLYAPDQPTFTNVKVMLPEILRNEARLWFNDAASGKAIRKNITVQIRNSNGVTKMAATLFDAFPISYDNENVLLELNVERIQISQLATFGQQDGFDDTELPVESTHHVVTTGGAGAADNYAIQVAGGSQRVELTELTIGSDRFTTVSPAHKVVDTLRMRLTSASQFVLTWINDTVGGAQWKRQVSVAEVTGGPSRIFHDAFPTRVTFLNPLLLLEDGTAPAVLDISIKPIRVELQ